MPLVNLNQYFLYKLKLDSVTVTFWQRNGEFWRTHLLKL